MSENADCKCHEIEEEINARFPGASWNVDAACRAWNERSKELEDRNIVFEPFADACYACTCPTCGRFICGWCI